MRHFNKKWLAALMALCLTLSLAPTALMEETEPAPEAAAEIVASEPAAETEPVVEEPEAADEAPSEADDEEAEVAVDAMEAPIDEAVLDYGEDDAISFEAQLGQAENEAALYEGDGRVYINEFVFTDPEFRRYVWNYTGREKTNTYLTREQADAVKKIDVSNWDIASLTGIENFPNLETLSLDNNSRITSLELDEDEMEDSSWGSKLKYLSVRNCDNLSYLNCSNNALTRILLSGCINLQQLVCSSNRLETLDISGCTALKQLYCAGNRLENLDFSNNSALTLIKCGNNRLSSLDVGHLTQLEALYCEKNQLTSLDVSGHEALNTLECYGNGLTTLDISGDGALVRLHCENNKLSTLDISDAPNVLRYVLQNEDLTVSDGVVRYGNMFYGMSYDEKTELITDKAAHTPIVDTTTATPSTETIVPAVQETVFPTISAVKKSSRTTISAAPGAYYQLDLGGATGKKFKSSKNKVATVDSTGLVMIRKAGKTKLTFKVGKKKRTVVLTVKDPTVPTSIALNLSGIQAAQVGEPQTLTVTLPEGTTSGIKWKSSNKRIATVSGGVVTFKRPGKVTITATATRGKKKAKVKFKVSR